jgi:hypothetical protein
MEQLGPEHKEVTGRIAAMVREIEQWWAQLQQESAAPPPAEADAPASSRAKRRLSSATSRLFGGREVKMADGAGEAAANALAGEVKMAGGAKQGHQVAFSSV